MTRSSPSSLSNLASSLDVFLVALLALLAVAALFMTIATGYHLSTGKAPSVDGYEIRLSTDLPALTLQTSNGEPMEIEIESATAVIPLYQASRSLHIVSILGIFVLFGVVGAGLIQLRRFLRSIRQGQPFIAANAQRLRSLAWLIQVGGAAYGGLYLLIGALVRQEIPEFNFRLPLNVPLIALFFSMVIFIIAEVFRIGVQMQEEQDLTV